MPAAGEHLSAPVKGCSGTQRAKVKRSRLVLSLLAVYAVQRRFPAQWKMVVCNQQKPTLSFSKNADGYVVRQRNNRDEKQKINCTRGISITGENGDPTGTIIDDHRNFDNYRLYTFVVTYEKSADKTDKKVVARSYIRYYDANGWLRVFYNDYKKNMYYGGCLCSFKQVSGIALSKQSQQAEPAQETGD